MSVPATYSKSRMVSTNESGLAREWHKTHKLSILIVIIYLSLYPESTIYRKGHPSCIIRRVRFDGSRIYCAYEMEVSRQISLAPKH